MAGLPLGVQLYTLRDACEKDMAGTLKKVARIGYKTVELAGYGNLSIQDLKKALADAGLKATAAHVKIELLSTELDKVLDEHEFLGNRNIVMPWLNADRRTCAADWKSVARILDKAGRACVKRGFTLSHHNHDFEFKWYDGKTAWDILLENTDPAHLKVELDVFWARFAGFCPACFIRELGPRLLMVHLKDLRPFEPYHRFENVGRGILDFPTIIAAAKKEHVKAFFVEQDDCYDGQAPFDALKIGYKNLQKMGFAS
jgi:sugar phosphate isomerase/epimerase